VKWPGVVKAGSVCKQLVLQADTLATLAEILGTTLPETAGEDSFSLMPLLKGEDRPIRTNAVNTACGGTPSYRESAWKYVAAAKPELYNLDEDLAESMNVAPLHPDRVKAMQAAFEKLIRAGRSTPGAPQKNDIKVVRYPKATAPAKAKKK
jgi:arylsulfatase A-like enzyme